MKGRPSGGRLYLRGRVWWIRYSVLGRRYRESTHGYSRDAAAAFLRQRVRQLTETPEALAVEALSVRVARLEGEITHHIKNEWRTVLGIARGHIKLMERHLRRANGGA